MVDFVAGCLGGLSGIFIGYPFDTVKVRLQGQDPLQKKYTSTWNCFSQIVKNESVFGFYKGITAPLYGQIAINAIIFGVYGNVLRQLHEDNAKTQFIAGAAAGGVQSFVCSPMELVKIRLQMQVTDQKQKSDSKTDKYKYKNSIDCIKKIYKHENGIRGLYRGLHATLWREIPSFGVYFSTYYYLCDITGAIHNGDIKIGRLLLCGGIAGITSWVSTYPFDVIKTKQQADGAGRYLYNGIIDCSVKSYKQEGLVAFFRGFNVTLLRAFPGNAATLATVTLFMDFVRTTDLLV